MRPQSQSLVDIASSIFSWRPNQSENNIPDTKVLNFIALHDYSTKKRLFCSKKALGLPRTFSRHIRHAETLNSHSKTAKTPKCIWKSCVCFHLPTRKWSRKRFEFCRTAWLFYQKTIILLKKSSRAAAHIFQAHSSRWNIEQP